MKKTRLLLPATLALLTFNFIIMNAAKSRDASLNRNLTSFNAIVKELELNYVDTLNPDKILRDAVDGLLSEIDPYTVYYDAGEQEQLVKMTTGDYGGIGSYIVERNGATYISEPMSGSPAMMAGLRAGDHIIRVDSTDVSKKGSADVTKMLRGIPGTYVDVVVERPYLQGNDSVFEFKIERKKLHESSVPYYTLLPDGLGYIKLTSFIDKTPEEVKVALDSFKKVPQMKGLILDLRGNGGGLLESAIDVLGFFLPKDTEVLRTRGRNVLSEKIYRTPRNPLMPEIPIAVLIDNGSASAAEITAGAFQDLDRAVLLGSRSYGKGLVQSTRPLPYEGLLKVTTAKYYIPSGRLIQALDYSRRNPDGSVSRTPDSLTNVFRTKNGREVRDGGGLKPDIEIDWGQPSRLVYNIVRDLWAFDYANRFAATHDTIGAVEDFVITDSIYSDFKKSIDPARFQYDKVGEDLLKQLREVIKAEGYMNVETSAAIDSLGVLLTHDLDGDLELKREEISEYLAQEIVTRYYYERGRIMESLKHDKGLKEARTILLDSEKYKGLLSKPKSK